MVSYERTRPDPEWVDRRVSVEGMPVRVQLDLSWDRVPIKQRPPNLFEYGHDIWPRAWYSVPGAIERYFAQLSCRVVERHARNEVNGCHFVGSYRKPDECGVLVAMWDMDAHKYLSEAMRRAWPTRKSAYKHASHGHWDFYDRVLGFLGKSGERPAGSES